MSIGVPTASSGGRSTRKIKASTGQKWAEARRSGRGNRVRSQHGAEGGWSGSGDAMKGASEVALVGKAEVATDIGQRRLATHHPFASFADAETLDVLADAPSAEATEDARHVHGMDAGLAREIVHGEAIAVLGSQLLMNAPQPERSHRATLGLESHHAHQFRDKALDLQIDGVERGASFGVELE